MASEVKTGIVTITPEKAEALLKTNFDNRIIRNNVVAKYARDMAAGNWKLNGESIKVSEDGTVIDGQHRLLGCVMSGVPFETLVIRGLVLDVRETIDTGARRSFADVLRWHGEVQTTSLAAAIETSIIWDTTGIPAHRGMAHSNADRLAYLQANPDLRDAVRLWNPLARPPFRFPMSCGSAFYTRAARLAPGEAEVFLDSVRSGANLDEDHPISRLRSFLFKAATSKSTWPREEYAAMCIKAWNLWLQGRSTRYLTWRRGGSSPEDFPMMLGPDGRTYEDFLTQPDPTDTTLDIPDAAKPDELLWP